MDYNNAMIKDLILKKKSSIVEKWSQLIFKTYPEETSQFLQLENNRFTNPVGYNIVSAANLLFDELLNDINPGTVKPILLDIIKIRAVQDFTPSEAIAFIFLIKEVIREKLKEELKNAELCSELLRFESKIDRVALIAFDLFQECREKVHQIHLKEIKSNSMNVFGNADGVKNN